jgi:DNA-directed RNA polymerase specialized sigma24 family protein
MVELKKDWEPSRAAFRQLLLWLDEGQDSSGEKYLEVRRRLELYFDRKNCRFPGELADETLNRVARKLEEAGAITNVTPLQYCYIVAKFVFLESLRDGKRAETDLAASEELFHKRADLFEGHKHDSEQREQISACLESCLAKLLETDRETILEYYRGQQRTKIEGRNALAERLGLTANALSIRACRIRQKLELCMRSCCEKGDRF